MTQPKFIIKLPTTTLRYLVDNSLLRKGIIQIYAESYHYDEMLGMCMKKMIFYNILFVAFK